MVVEPARGKYGISRDWLWVLLPIGVFALLMVLLPCPLMEDAYIMLRYAVNIAQGYGVVFNPGDVAVWGCTSMFTTLVLAGLVLMGVNPLIAPQGVGVVSGVLLILTVYITERRLLGMPNFPAVASCVVLGASHIVSLSLMGFDAMLFTFLMALLFSISLWAIQQPDLRSNSLPLYLLLIVAIVLTLTRIEGVLVSLVTFVVVFYLKRDIGFPRFFVQVVLPYLVPVTLFFVWAQLYFGWLLPNPFYIKAGTLPIYPLSVLYTVTFLGFYIFSFCLILRATRSSQRRGHSSWRQFRMLIISALPTAMYGLAYLAIYPKQNVEWRFQFPMLPVIIILSAQAIFYYFPFDISRPFPPRSFRFNDVVSKGIVLFLAFSIATPVLQRFAMLPFGELPQPIYVGQVLNNYSDQGYTMIVTEAGRIPYYANWRTIDAYGLNDPFIAHNDYSEAYLDTFDAEVIMFNSAKYGSNSTAWEVDSDPWEVLCLNMHNYVLARNYTLACIYRVHLRFGILGTVVIGHHWFFVRNDFPHSDAIYNDLRSIPTVDYEYL